MFAAVMPRVPVVLFIVACGLLLLAFNSRHGGNSFRFNYGHSNDLAARLAHSEKLWAKSLHGRKHMKDQWGLESNRQKKFPKEYLRPYNLYEFIYPAFNCPHDVERVGRVGDGGKWVCGMTRYEANTERPCVVYSFGVNDDSGFENDILNRTNCEIWGYDFSVQGWGAGLDSRNAHRAHFKQAAISAVTDETHSPPSYAVRDLMLNNGHDYVDIMKMDIEGSEYDALRAFLGNFPGSENELPVGQLLLETHMPPPSEEPDPPKYGSHDDVAKREGWSPRFSLPKNLDDWLQFWDMLESKGLRIFSVEANELGNMKYNVPLFAESSMINVADKKSLLTH